VAKVRTSIFLTPEQLDRLRLLSNCKHTPMAALVREGIDSILNKLHEEQSNEETKTKVR